MKNTDLVRNLGQVSLIHKRQQISKTLFNYSILKIPDS